MRQQTDTYIYIYMSIGFVYELDSLQKKRTCTRSSLCMFVAAKYVGFFLNVHLSR